MNDELKREFVSQLKDSSLVILFFAGLFAVTFFFYLFSDIFLNAAIITLNSLIFSIVFFPLFDLVVSYIIVRRRQNKRNRK